LVVVVVVVVRRLGGLLSYQGKRVGLLVGVR
jgi:hypothetical protein